MQTEPVHFHNADGQTLAGRLDMPVDDRPVACALFAHCFTCGKNLKSIAHISRALTRHGIAVLRFDFTGLGESEGDFADTNFSSNVQDLVAAARYMEETMAPPAILIGHSLGGAAVLQAARQISSARAVATIAAPSEPTHVAELLDDKRDELEAHGEARVTLAGRPFRIRKQFLDDLEAQSMREVIRGLRRPLAIFHSPLDRTVGIDNAAAIFEAARHPKRFVSLDQADHLLSREADAQYVGTVIAAWAEKYLETPEREQREQSSDDGAVTASTERGGLRTELQAAGHGLIADEPASAGGTGAGPSPYDYLAAALGACTTMTLRMYADQKGWPLEAATARVRHAKIHARDCESCETQQGRVDRLDREIELEGELTAEQRERLLEIADKCPVHRTLHSEIVVETHLSEE